ncbi:hypothetical protein EPN28_01875 [Patescibacteria group bacterium]|nr:MAG: hypothetical protein EPN28_01875 [Patescibacteria group bacterium]
MASEIHNPEVEKKQRPASEGKTGSIMDHIYHKLGEKIGWKNATSDTAKVADVELLSMTGYDSDFLVEHHRMRDFLEANEIWRGGYNPADIYQGIADKAEMTVKIEVAGKKLKADLRQLAQLACIREMNRMLGLNKINDQTLIEKYFNGEELVVQSKKGPIDLREKCPLDTLVDFDTQGYLDKIRANQIGFQYIGGLRDSALDKHHIENASHTLFLASGETKVNGAAEFLWLPVCETMSKNDARTDLRKKGIPFLAEGHVHEIGKFNEYTGTTVEFELPLLQMHRKNISNERQHERTLARTQNAAVALGPKENFVVYTQKLERPKEDGTNGPKEDYRIIDIGNNRRGQIYQGLHSTYDEALRDIRGYGLEQDEADDKIFTDIIAPFLYNNPRDWLMCLAKAAGTDFFTAGEAINERFDWGNKKICLKIRCRNLKKEREGFPVEEQYFYNIKELVAYLNARVKMGDIKDAAAMVEHKGATDEEQAREALEEGEEGEEQAGEEEIKSLSHELLTNFTGLFNKLFGDDAAQAAEIYFEKGVAGEITIDNQRYVLEEYLEKLLGKADDSLILRVSQLSPPEGIGAIIKMLKLFSAEAKRQLLDNIKVQTPPKKPKSRKRK